MTMDTRIAERYTVSNTSERKAHPTPIASDTKNSS